MCDERMDVAYCLRKAGDYRQKAKAVSEPRRRLLSKLSHGSTWRKRVSLILHFPQMAGIESAQRFFIAGLDQRTK
jgi:hypothetical protein